MFVFVKAKVDGNSIVSNSMFALSFIAVDENSKIVGRGIYKIKEIEGRKKSKKAMEYWLSSENIDEYNKLHEDPLLPKEAMTQFAKDLKPFMQMRPLSFVSDNPVVDIGFINFYAEYFHDIQDYIDYEHYIDTKSIATYFTEESYKEEFNENLYMRKMKTGNAGLATTIEMYEDIEKDVFLYVPLLESVKTKNERTKKKIGIIEDDSDFRKWQEEMKETKRLGQLRTEKYNRYRASLDELEKTKVKLGIKDIWSDKTEQGAELRKIKEKIDKEFFSK